MRPSCTLFILRPLTVVLLTLYLYTYTVSAPETLWDENADGFEAGIKSFRLVAPNKKKFREPGNEGLLPPLPF